MADAAKAVDSTMGDNIVYISVLNRLSVDCDCDGYPDEPDMHDIGVLASADPLAIDQAAIDLVYAMPDRRRDDPATAAVAGGRHEHGQRRDVHDHRPCHQDHQPRRDEDRAGLKAVHHLHSVHHGFCLGDGHDR